MENLLLPSKVELQEGATPNSGTVIITPCYHGYGTTLGNGLRRVLLSSLPGAAVEAFKVKGVQHEFSTVEGVKEDVVEIMLNLKQMALKVFTDEPVILILNKKGPGAVTAKDIEPNANVEIINRDLIIAHLTANKTLEMEIAVGRGRGFKPAEEKNRQNYDLGTIVVDSIYTPIRDIGYKVEYTRVGDITNYEKLILNIETNGTISPRDAIYQATQILMDHFSIVLNYLGRGEEDAAGPVETGEELSLFSTAAAPEKRPNETKEGKKAEKKSAKGESASGGKAAIKAEKKEAKTNPARATAKAGQAGSRLREKTAKKK